MSHLAPYGNRVYAGSIVKGLGDDLKGRGKEYER